ncbi:MULTISPECIES: hypothetical protein [Exiguobacterium]|uniref:hypothetical protein n=1 Tax=Exiguobacterium TaxID=33986 RepID=UPI00047BAAB9|nr:MULTISPECIES: hypothetical protein [Exiguobacterium]MCT4781523.1 hypothetical protein [Exiguobacterium soli]
MNYEIATYFVIFVLGVLFVLPACYFLVIQFGNKQYPFFKKLKWTVVLLLGLLCLWMTVPSFTTEMVFRDYRVSEGTCILKSVESKGTAIEITLSETNKTFSFRNALILKSSVKHTRTTVG